MVYELELVFRVCNGFLRSMPVTYDGAALLWQLFLSFLSFRLIPKKPMSSYTGMEECKKTNTTTKRKM